jgi:putative phosphoribosyl transferase
MDLLTPTEDEDTAARFDIGLLTERLVDAVRWLRNSPSAGNLPLGLFGASTGAAAALESAAILGPDVGAVVSRGGRPDLASPRSLARVSAPTLLLVGAKDSEVVLMNRQAFALLQCEKKMILVPGATHLFEEPGTLEEVARLAAEWFTGHFSRPAEERPRPPHP